MRPIRKIATASGEKHGREVDFEIVEEPWCRYTLKDGGSARVRSTATSIFHLCDEAGKPRFLTEGQPDLWIVYQVQIASGD